MNSYNRQDVLRILQISSHQLLGWERAGLIAPLESYSFQDLGQLRTVRALRAEAVPAAAIRNTVQAMKAVAGMANPLIEASLVKNGTRLAFRHCGAMVDPIRRQLLFDFERIERMSHEDRPSAVSEITPVRTSEADEQHDVQERFLAAVQAEEAGEKQQAIDLYEQIIELDPSYAAAYINLGTIYFHLRLFDTAEQLYRQATVADPTYVLAYFDLGNVLDELQRLSESIAVYRQAIALAPRYADAHYNLALAHERLGERRPALRHWYAYIKLDSQGPWADHARSQIRKLLSREKLSITSRSVEFVPSRKGTADLQLIGKR